MNIFTDDLELAVRNMGHEDFKIDIEFESQTDSLISNYVLSVFEISHGGNELDLDWVGYECDYDVTYVYVESEKFQLDSTLTVNQGLLMDVYDDQENVVDFESSKSESNYILVKGQHKVEIVE